MSAPREELEAVLAAEVRPALSSHAGTIRVAAVDEERRLVTLQMLGPCGTCYFRRGCQANLIEPVVEETLAAHGYRLRITGSPHGGHARRGPGGPQ